MRRPCTVAHLMVSVAAAAIGKSLGILCQSAALNTPALLQVPSAEASGTTWSPGDRLDTCIGRWGLGIDDYSNT
jgi:hypothetical protein